MIKLHKMKFKHARVVNDIRDGYRNIYISTNSFLFIGVLRIISWVFWIGFFIMNIFALGIGWGELLGMN